jgi:hypothetical protein
MNYYFNILPQIQTRLRGRPKNREVREDGRIVDGEKYITERNGRSS